MFHLGSEVVNALENVHILPLENRDVHDEGSQDVDDAANPLCEPDLHDLSAMTILPESYWRELLI